MIPVMRARFTVPDTTQRHEAGPPTCDHALLRRRRPAERVPPLARPARPVRRTHGLRPGCGRRGLDLRGGGRRVPHHAPAGAEAAAAARGGRSSRARAAPPLRAALPGDRAHAQLQGRRARPLRRARDRCGSRAHRSRLGPHAGRLARAAGLVRGLRAPGGALVRAADRRVRRRARRGPAPRHRAPRAVRGGAGVRGLQPRRPRLRAHPRAAPGRRCPFPPTPRWWAGSAASCRRRTRSR